MGFKKFNAQQLDNFSPKINLIHSFPIFHTIKEAKAYCREINWTQHNIIKIEKRFETGYIVASVEDHTHEVCINIALSTFTGDKRDVLVLRSPKERQATLRNKN